MNSVNLEQNPIQVWQTKVNQGRTMSRDSIPGQRRNTEFYPIFEEYSLSFFKGARAYALHKSYFAKPINYFLHPSSSLAGVKEHFC